MSNNYNTLNSYSNYYYTGTAQTMGDNFGSLYNPVQFNMQYHLAGVTVGFEIRNTDEADPNSQTQIAIVAGNPSTGDAWLTYRINGGNYWSSGLRNVDDDSFYLTNQLDLTSGLVMKATSAGNITKPMNCAFFAVRSANVSNATGDGTVYTIINDTEIFDIGSNYNNSTGIFTAPVTGKYRFSFSSWITNVGSGNQYSVQINTTSKRYSAFSANPSSIKSSIGEIITSGCFLCDMTAGDVASAMVSVTGQAKTITAAGNGEPLSCFQGELVQ